MYRILLAASPESQEICQRILKNHYLLCVATVPEAQQYLEAGNIDLIICTLVFDDSRMIDLLRLVKEHRKWKHIPFICLRLVSRILDHPNTLEGIQNACEALGAAAFLDIGCYSVAPEKQMLEDIEKHLPSRKKPSRN
jgi:hypothetical protein